MTREEIVERLRKEILTVTFTKADRTKRTMICTLMPEHLPPRDQSVSGAKQRSRPEDIVVAYDLEKTAFRSFNVNSVESVE